MKKKKGDDNKNVAVYFGSYIAELLDYLLISWEKVNNCMQMNKLSISKYKSTINNHLWLSDLNSVQLTNASLKENAA